jgi:FAD/FMN-containing dehydrogenase
MIVLLGLCLCVVVLVASIVLWRASDRPGKRLSVCPTNVFDVTSRDLWPCQALVNLTALGVEPKQVSDCVPAVFPWDPPYNTLRLNVALQQQRLPLFVVPARRERDIVRAIRLAQRYGLLLSIRSGGHCNEAFSIENAIVITLGCFNGIRLDDGRGILTCEGGVTQGQVFKILDKSKWAFPLAHRHHSGAPALNTGTVSDVGLSGIVSAGGVGFLQRQLGLTIDALISLRVALADGRVVTATPSNEYADLFSAMRGSGGGNFGVITRLVFQLPRIGDLIIFTILYSDWTQAAAVFTLWQSLAQFFPQALTQQLYLAVPSGATSPTVSSSGVYIGTDQAALEALLAPFLAIPGATITYQVSNFAGQARRFASGRTYHPFSYRRTQYAFVPLSPTGIATLIAQVNAAVGLAGVHTIESVLAECPKLIYRA